MVARTYNDFENEDAMSFLDRIKGAGRKNEADIPLPSAPFDELSPPATPGAA